MQEINSLNTNSTSVPAAVNQDVKTNNVAQPYLLPLLILLVVLSIGSTAFLYYQNTQLKEVNSILIENMTSKTEKIDQKNSLSPDTTQKQETTVKETTNTLNQIVKQDLKELTTTIGGMSITFPTNWKLSEISTDDSFPLKQRLYGLYEKNEAIAVSNGKVSLIITIDEMKENMGAGGSFANEEEYNQFVKNIDRVVIGDSTFFFSKASEKMNDLESAESGPWGWGALSEYFPEYQNQAGKIEKAYDSVIKRSGKGYNFILVSKNGGPTDAATQKELLTMLKTIKW